jgi:hypothetical protein
VFNSGILELAIGLVFVYLVLGLICTSANEWIAGLLNWRASTLEEGIRRLLSDGFHLLRPADFKDLPALAAKLAKATDPLSVYLRGRLSPETKEALQNLDSVSPAALAQSLLADLNQVIEGECIYTKERFKKVKLNRETRRVAGSVPRGEDCEFANRNLLQEAYSDEIGGVADLFYRHPLIKVLARRGQRPSYVPGRTFALAVIDMVAGGRSGAAQSAAALADAVRNLPDGDLKGSLNAILQDAGNDIWKLRHGLELWFDDAMERVSGWYKRKTHAMVVVLAAVVTLFTNADTIRMANMLWASPALRAEVVAQAEAAAGKEPGAQPDRRVLEPLIGWQTDFHRLGEAWNQPGADRGAAFGNWLAALVADHFSGWLLTTIAVSLGAPFWFDILKKVVNLRSSGKAPEQAPTKTSATAA